MMIVSLNPKPSAEEFKALMRNTDLALNQYAAHNQEYYKTRNGSLLEDDVKAVLEECAQGTPFENTIEKISGQKFPDIVAAKFYGVEVKSTKEDHWTSTGSSILESSRVQGVERIYLTFGKLGGTVKFLSKPYEECLCGIAVTHMPRYLIDMRLQEGRTIFDKLGIPYDTLRKMENPVEPVASYYKSQLKPGESLWWAGDRADESVPATIRLWKTLSEEEKRKQTIYGCVNYPEVFGGDYDRYALWLTKTQSIVDPHIRDQFSAGGRVKMRMGDGSQKRFPAIYGRIADNLEIFKRRMCQPDTAVWEQGPTLDATALKQRLMEWSKRASQAVQQTKHIKKEDRISYEESMEALEILFSSCF